MKIECNLTGTVLRKNERTAKNGTVYYSLLLLQTEEAINLPCTKEVFEQVEQGKDSTFEVDYNEGTWNGQPYHNFRIVDVVPFVDEKKSASKPA